MNSDNDVSQKSGSTHSMTDKSIKTDIAVGVPMFEREQALRDLLDSVPDYVTTVYVADNGQGTDRELYRETWPFELTVFNLPYDCGIGKCRRVIADACTKPYLWVGDNDMRFLNDGDLLRLHKILESQPDLGGVAGWLLENDTLRSAAADLEQHGDTIVKNLDRSPTVETDPLPHARFDMVPQAALFRTKVFETYTYDESIYNSEHLDFFIGHWGRDEWEFASTPAVVIEHQRNIDKEYREETRGKYRADFNMTGQKWGIWDRQPGSRIDWCSSNRRGAGQRAFDMFRTAVPARVWVPARRLLVAAVE